MTNDRTARIDFIYIKLVFGYEPQEIKETYSTRYNKGDRTFERDLKEARQKLKDARQRIRQNILTI